MLATLNLSTHQPLSHTQLSPARAHSACFHERRLFVMDQEALAVSVYEVGPVRLSAVISLEGVAGRQVVAWRPVGQALVLLVERQEPLLALFAASGWVDGLVVPRYTDYLLQVLPGRKVAVSSLVRVSHPHPILIYTVTPTHLSLQSRLQFYLPG